MARDELPVGREKAPSWEKIYFQLENFISPVSWKHEIEGSLRFWWFPLYVLTFNGIRNMGLKGVKIFDIEL